MAGCVKWVGAPSCRGSIVVRLALFLFIILLCTISSLPLAVKGIELKRNHKSCESLSPKEHREGYKGRGEEKENVCVYSV